MSDDAIVRMPGASAPPAEAVPSRRKMQGLGRGLGALLGEVRRDEPIGQAGRSNAGGMAVLPIAEITPHPDQPRRHPRHWMKDD